MQKCLQQSEARCLGLIKQATQWSSSTHQISTTFWSHVGHAQELATWMIWTQAFKSRCVYSALAKQSKPIPNGWRPKKKKNLWIEEGEEMLSPRKSIWIGFEKETKKLAYLGRKQLASPMNFNQGTISFRNRLWFLLLIHSVTFQLKCHFPRKGLLACSSHPPS